MGFDEPARGRQPEAGTARRSSTVAAPEALEHALTRFGVETIARVLYRELHLVVEGFDANGDGPVSGRVLKRVRQQVHEHPLDLLGSEPVCDPLVDLGGKANLTQPRLSLHAAEAERDDRGDRQVPELESERAGVYLGQLEQVVHDLGENVYLLAQRGDVLMG